MIRSNSLDRKQFQSQLSALLSRSPVVAILGPRQCGKTTLARAHFDAQTEPAKKRLNYFDLEDPDDLARLEAGKTALGPLEGLVVIDEIQRRPELFPLLRVLVDRRPSKAKFLVLGSASRELIRQSSESLAGRIEYLELTPFNLLESGVDQSERLWMRGGFPRSFLAASDEDSRAWRKSFIRTYLEQDIPQLGIQIPAETLRRFWTMLAHYHGQIFNASEISRSMSVGDTTARRYLDILTGTFMVRRLPPWTENVGKRQVKSPKIYFRDSGIFHELLGISDPAALRMHPKLGASWEGFALEEVIRTRQGSGTDFYFWSVHQQCELDLLAVADGRKIGFEFKFGDQPRLTSSLRQALDLLKLDHAYVVHPGEVTFPLSERVTATTLPDVLKTLSSP